MDREETVMSVQSLEATPVELVEPDGYLTILPSLLCNIRCKFCYQDRFDHKVHLSREVLFERLTAVYERTRNLTLLGGEPTVIPEFDQLAEHVLAAYPAIQLQIVTNGVKINERWFAVLSHPRVTATVSLNASASDIYARTQNVENGARFWERAYATTLRVAARRRAADEIDQGLTISMVATRETREDVLDFVAMAFVLGLNAKILVDCRGLDYQTREGVIDDYPLLRSLSGRRIGRTEIRVINIVDDTEVVSTTSGTADALARLAACVTRMESRLSDVDLPRKQTLQHFSDIVLASTPDSNRPFGAVNGKVRGRDVCLAPWKGVVVGHQGDVYCCSRMTNHPIGNVERQDIEEILEGPKLADVRERMLKGMYSYCDPDCPANLGKESSWRKALADFDRGDLQLALRRFRFLSNDLQSASARDLYSYAYCEHVLGSTDSALDLYTKSLSAGFDRFWVLYHRAQVWQKRGELAAALSDAREALAASPDHSDAAQLVATIHALQKRVSA
ncbi:radical SAM protein [Xanthobacteraceae bacterium Astr-EGSB]|uniref:radical SAM protein n=1 Tax=Astrobacterium formosum TaxID=3069710 RepID=UPI0027B37DC9|nr:radical SAM protein [Xanthobacteraceae bacterium Astr-EGSB]